MSFFCLIKTKNRLSLNRSQSFGNIKVEEPQTHLGQKGTTGKDKCEFHVDVTFLLHFLSPFPTMIMGDDTKRLSFLSDRPKNKKNCNTQSFLARLHRVVFIFDSGLNIFRLSRLCQNGVVVF